MKNRNSEINSLFKNSLDATDQAKWDKICKNYTLDLMLNLFIWWVSSKERYLRSDKFVSSGIIWKLKDRNNISYIKPENYNAFYRLFPLFYKFYKENWSNLQDLFGDDIYQSKKNSLKNISDLKKIIEWQKYLEEDDSEHARKYLNKLKYIYRIFSENELIEIFKWYLSAAQKLHNLRNWSEDVSQWDNPFDIVKREMDDNIQKKINNIGEENLWIIHSLFSRYLQVLKINKKLQANLKIEGWQSKGIQQATKGNLYDDLDTDEENIVSVRMSEGGSEDTDYVDWNPVAPIKNFMKPHTGIDIYPEDEL